MSTPRGVYWSKYGNHLFTSILNSLCLTLKSLQVSARESLEFVRARQQAEHTSRTAAHYEFVNENENDYDGIYETVNEGQMSPQPERPPPLPNNRQSQVCYVSWPVREAMHYACINQGPCE